MFGKKKNKEMDPNDLADFLEKKREDETRRSIKKLESILNDYSKLVGVNPQPETKKPGEEDKIEPGDVV